MKKLILLFILSCLMTSPYLFADDGAWGTSLFDEAEESYEAPEFIEESTYNKKTVATNAVSRGELVALNSSQVKSRLQNLERKVGELERERRFQDDRIRSLERTVNDLRRKVF